MIKSVWIGALTAAVAAGLCIGCVGGKGGKAANTGVTAPREINDDGFDMVFVEGGTFTMGCTVEQGNECDDGNEPAHEVTVRGFYIGKYEITQGQWKAVMGSNPSEFTGDNNLPVENVSWNDAQKFIRKLNAKTGKSYRLPAEAEWEFAARGGNRSKGYRYSGGNNVNDVAWYLYDRSSSSAIKDNFKHYGGNSGKKTHPVGTKQPNELGIYDMSGNVSEFTNGVCKLYPYDCDAYDCDVYDFGPGYITRGGSWHDSARYCRVSHRDSNVPDFTFSNMGFRLAIDHAAEPDRRGNASESPVEPEPDAPRSIVGIHYESVAYPSYSDNVVVVKTDTGALARNYKNVHTYNETLLEISLSMKDWHDFLNMLDESGINTWKKEYVVGYLDSWGWGLTLIFSDNDSIVYYGDVLPPNWHKFEKLISKMRERIKRETIGKLEDELSAVYQKRFGTPITDLERLTSNVSFFTSGYRYSDSNDFSCSNDFSLGLNRTKTGARVNLNRYGAGRYSMELNMEEWAGFMNALYGLHPETWEKDYKSGLSKYPQWELQIFTSDMLFSKINSRGSDLYPPNWGAFKKLIDTIEKRITGRTATTPETNLGQAEPVDMNIDMALVEGGTFTMGCIEKKFIRCYYTDAEPAHTVTVGSFYMSKREITQRLWNAVMDTNPSYFKGDDNLPVETVCWNDVQEFIRRLNAKTGKIYRLPTEAEWEFAARGGNDSKGYKFPGSNTIGNVAWYDQNSGERTHPAGSKRPNELGIYDMSGNVSEWVSDWHGDYDANAQTNPTGPASGSAHVIRGGSWNDFKGNSHVFNRYYVAPGGCGNRLGFRLAIDP